MDNINNYPDVSKAITEAFKILESAIEKVGYLNPELSASVELDNGKKYFLSFKRIDQD